MLTKRDPLKFITDATMRMVGKCQTCGERVEVLKRDAHMDGKRSTNPLRDLYYAECQRCKTACVSEPKTGTKVYLAPVPKPTVDAYVMDGLEDAKNLGECERIVLPCRAEAARVRLGRVNPTTAEIRKKQYPPGTLLWSGVECETPHESVGGDAVWSVSLLYRDGGWNNDWWREGSQWVEVRDADGRIRYEAW